MSAEHEISPTAADAAAIANTEHHVLRSLALQAQGLTGADIEKLLREARRAARRERRKLVVTDLTSLLASTKPRKSEAVRRRSAIHEAGHAVVRLVLGLGSITIITIDGPGGTAYVSGTTTTLEEETEARGMATLAVTLAGRAAEEVLLGEASAGAGGSSQSDLASATNLACAMETAFGFSKSWPLLYRPSDDLTSLLLSDPELASHVNQRLETAYARATSIVADNRQAIELLTAALIDRGTLEGPELEAELAKVRAVLVATAAPPG